MKEGNYFWVDEEECYTSAREWYLLEEPNVKVAGYVNDELGEIYLNTGGRVISMENILVPDFYVNRIGRDTEFIVHSLDREPLFTVPMEIVHDEYCNKLHIYDIVIRGYLKKLEEHGLVGMKPYII